MTPAYIIKIVCSFRSRDQPRCKPLALLRNPAEVPRDRAFFAARITELDGLRAVAVGLVFLNHFAPVATFPQLAFLKSFGWIGVDIFFVISGFLITGILLDSRSRHYYRDFYVRRTLRIFPLTTLFLPPLIASMLLYRGGLHYQQMVEGWGSPAWLFLYLGNVKTAVSGVEPPAVFVPLWSLHVEEQFYLLFPFIVHNASRNTLRRLLIAMIVGAPLLRICLWWLAPEKELLQFMLLPCRMDGLALGGLIALRLRMGEWNISKAGLGAAIAVLFALSVAVFAAGGRVQVAHLKRTLGYSVSAMTFAGVVLWIVLFRGSRATNWLNTGPMQFIGMISYGLYLYQTPAGDLLAGLAGSRLPNNWLETLGGSNLLWIVLVAVATLSWYVIEQPFLRMKDRLAPASR